jgi:cytochrome b561
MSARRANSRAARECNAGIEWRMAAATWDDRYSAPAIALHWLIALLILATVPLGLVMTELALSPTKLRLYSYHKWIGVTVFALACVRLAWRATHRPPALPPMPAWQAQMSRIVHRALYGLLLAVPLSGWLTARQRAYRPLSWLVAAARSGRARQGTRRSIRLLHKSLNVALATLVLAHVLAALKHQFVDRDRLLARIWPARKTREVGQ